jgi:hypothetical protein
MKELLERWARLESEDRVTAVDANGELIFTLAGHQYTIPVGDLESDPAAHAVLRAAVEEAITARGWGWELRYGMRPSKRPALATILRYRDGIPSGQSTCLGEPPAEALLSAYLTAVEAQG